MIELTDEMRAAVKRRMGIADGDDLDPWMGPAIEDVLAIIERDYRLDPYCNAELMPDVVCKHPRTSSPRHKHQAKLPATGNWVEWS